MRRVLKRIHSKKYLSVLDVPQKETDLLCECIEHGFATGGIVNRTASGKYVLDGRGKLNVTLEGYAFICGPFDNFKENFTLALSIANAVFILLATYTPYPKLFSDWLLRLFTR